LLREIASGPLSVTFIAGRQGGAKGDFVSVKVLRQRTKGDVDRLLRLRDATRELAALGHPRIVCVQDVARVGDLVALVSPYVDGIDLLDLAEILRAQSVVLPTRARCEIVLGIAEALDVAQHEIPPGGSAPLGRVHRDLRPSNVMIDRSGDLYVLDFGTGFTTLAGRAARAGALKKGIIKYMSPGRREGKRGGAPADVYSLGILATELFRGRWLRRLQSHNPAHYRYLAEVVARLVNLGLGSEQDELALRNVLLRMIAFDPDARPDAHEVAVTFQGLAERARGADLRRFVAQRGDTWTAVLDRTPETDLAGVPVHVLDTGTTWDDVPFYEGEVPDKLRLKAERDGVLWEETPQGWTETGDHADTLEAFFDQDDGDDDAAVPGSPDLDADDEATEPGGYLPRDLLETAAASAPAAPAETAPTLPPQPAPEPREAVTDPTLAAPRVDEPPPVAARADSSATTQRAVPAGDMTPAPPPARRPLPWVLIIGLLLFVLAVGGGLLVGVAIAWFS